MKRICILLVIVMFCVGNAQERYGMYAGLEYGVTSHINPYLFHEGTKSTPGFITTYNDQTNRFYIPFGLISYDKSGVYEMSSFALDGLVSMGLALINGHSFGESGSVETNGITPLLKNIKSNLGTKSPYGSSIAAEFVEVDWIRVMSSISLGELLGVNLPVFVGGQTGWGVFGIKHGTLANDILNAPDPQDNGSGLVSFNYNVELNYGLNLGYRYEFDNDGFLFVSFQYDWRTFLEKAGQDYITQGNRYTAEFTWFPFSNDGDWGDLFLKTYYRHNAVNYSRKTVEIDKVEYSNTTLGMSINYIIY